MGNVGDTRAVCGTAIKSNSDSGTDSSSGTINSGVTVIEAVDLSHDHKPNTPVEQMRIEAAGAG